MLFLPVLIISSDLSKFEEKKKWKRKKLFIWKIKDLKKIKEEEEVEMIKNYYLKTEKMRKRSKIFKKSQNLLLDLLFKKISRRPELSSQPLF